jgi:ribosomal protein S15
MPPRINVLPCLRAANGKLRYSDTLYRSTNCILVCTSTRNGSSLTLPFRPFSTSTPQQASSITGKRKFRDPYAQAQSRARKAANVSRQQELGQQRAEQLGDPVRGITTPFVESFDVGRDPKLDKVEHLNNFIKPEELSEQLEISKSLTLPFPITSRTPGYERKSKEELETANRNLLDKHNIVHDNVQEVMKRILDLDNANNPARLKVNIQRCIDTFGRHETDKSLVAKAKAMPIATSKGDNETIKFVDAEGVEHGDRGVFQNTERKGPDTGSPEVQIAILTAKIRSLANFLETRGRKDKVGKRDLRLLVHRRQKLLKYLRNRERGGPRWQKCIETLGLTEGTWQGEITL